MSVNDAQQYHTKQVHYLFADVTFSNDGETTSLGWVPAGASIVDAGANVTTAFDAGTTNTLNIGYRNGGNSETDDADEYASLIALGTAGIIAADDLATAAVNSFPGGAEITCGVVLTGTAATAGAATVWVQYIVDHGS